MTFKAYCQVTAAATKAALRSSILARISPQKMSISKNVRLLLVLLATILTGGLGATPRTFAATLTVCASGCSSTTIAGAVTAANNGDTINVLYAVDNESGIIVSKSLTIQGQGANNTVVDGGGNATVFSVNPSAHPQPGVSVIIQNMTIRNGSGAYGGGIYNNGALTVSGSTISGNSATYSGGIFNDSVGTLTIVNSTISSNAATFGGGGIYNNAGTLRVVNSTISGNSANQNGGGVYNFHGFETISNSTIVKNSAPNTGGLYNSIKTSGSTLVKNSIVGINPGGDCGPSGPITAAGANVDTDGSCGSSNFIQVTPAQLNLGSLALNPPGTTETMALMPGSVAIDAVTDCTDASGGPVATDQRGVSRPQGPDCDIGAYEMQVPSFFDGEILAGSGWYYLAFPSGQPPGYFGYYIYSFFPWLYHADMGWEYFVPESTGNGAYLFDNLLGQWLYTNPSDFPFLYNFSVAAWYWYEPAQDNPGHYTTNPRWFANMNTGAWIHSP